MSDTSWMSASPLPQPEPVVEPPDDDALRCKHPGCTATLLFKNKQALAAHQVIHLPPEAKAERVRKRAQTMARKKEQSMSVEARVQALIAASLVPGSVEARSRQKQWARAKSLGWSVEEFEEFQVRYFTAIVEGHDKLPTLGKVGRPSNEKKAADANNLFERVNQATRALYPDPSYFYDHFEEIADLRRHLFEVLKR